VGGAVDIEEAPPLHFPMVPAERGDLSAHRELEESGAANAWAAWSIASWARHFDVGELKGPRMVVRASSSRASISDIHFLLFCK